MAPLSVFLSVMLLLNIGLGVFNLIPVPPLDGSHVLEELLPASMSEAYAQIQPYGFFAALRLDVPRSIQRDLHSDLQLCTDDATVVIDLILGDTD